MQSIQILDGFSINEKNQTYLVTLASVDSIGIKFKNFLTSQPQDEPYNWIYLDLLCIINGVLINSEAC